MFGRAKDFYRRSGGDAFDSYEEGMRYFEEIFENFDPKKGLYIGKGVDLKKLAVESPLGDQEAGKVLPVHVPPGDSFGHTAVLGTTRRGKTRFLLALILQMIWMDEDVIVVEPKGSPGQEVIAWILEFLEMVGKLDHFKYISPVFENASLKYNTFFGMDDEGISSAVQNMIMADERFFADIGYEITMSICLGTRFLETLKRKEDVEAIIDAEYARTYGKRRIVDPVNLIADPSMLDAIFDPGSRIDVAEMEPPLRSLLSIGDIARYASRDGIIALYDKVNAVTDEQIRAVMSVNYPDERTAERKYAEAIRLRDEALKSLFAQKVKPQDYFSKVSTSYKLVLDKLSSGKLGSLLDTVRINPIYDILRYSETSSVFVLQPAPLMFKEAAVSLMRLMTSMIVNWFGRVGMSGRTFPRPINYVVDEAGAVLTPEVIEALNKGGGLKLKMTLATQSYFDYVDALGPEKAGIAFDNLNVKCFFAVNDDESRKKIAETFGSTKIADSSFASSNIDMRGQVRHAAEELMLSSHIGELPTQHFLYANKEEKMLVKAPMLEDPKYAIEMPYLEMEEDINRHYGNTMNEIRKWERSLSEENKEKHDENACAV